MPVLGRTQVSVRTVRGNPTTSFLGQTLTLNNSNVVKVLPVLPYPLTNGKITWNDNFDSNTSGSIEYTGIVSEDQAKIVKNAYKFTKQIDFYGIPLEVVSVSYDRKSTPVEEGEENQSRIDEYTVSVSLNGIFINIPEDVQKKASEIGYISYPTGQAVALGAGGSGWSFTENEVTTDGSNEIAIPTEGYNHAEISFDQGQSESGAGKLTRFALQEPVEETTVESSKDFYSPPENTYVIRDMSLLYDESGDKKVYRSSLSIDGKPARDLTLTTGMVYRMIDVWDAVREEILSRNVNNLWKVIEFRKTDYIYSRIGAVSLNVTVYPPGGITPISYIVHPDYAAFTSVDSSGNHLTMRSNAEFLVEEVTRGWRLSRLKKEDDTTNSVDEEEDSEYQPLFEHKPTALISRTIYRLRSSRGLYGEKIEPPFSVSFEDYKSLEPRIKNMVSSASVTEDGKVAILYPDPNFVEPLYVSQQVQSENSFAWANDPDADEPDPEVFIPGTDRVKPAKRLTTGQESYNDTQRFIKKPELYADGTVKLKLYSEMVKQFSSQDPGFDNAIEQINVRDGSGDPPEATYRIRQYKSIDKDYNTGNGNTPRRYFATTPDIAGRLPYNSGSASASHAKSIGEAIAYLQLQLRKSSMQSNQRSLTVFGFHPTMRAGQAISVPKDLFAGMGVWRITGVSWTLEYKTENSPLGVLVTHPGTQISCGLDMVRSIATSSEAPDDSNPASTGEGGAQVSLEYGPDELGSVLEVMPNRRNF